MLHERACANCSALVIFNRGRTWDVAGRGGPHWCAPVQEPLADIIGCARCPAVVWRAADGTKTDTTTGDLHHCRGAALQPVAASQVVQEQARGGATPPPRPVAPEIPFQRRPGSPHGPILRPVVELDL